MVGTLIEISDNGKAKFTINAPENTYGLAGELLSTSKMVDTNGTGYLSTSRDDSSISESSEKYSPSASVVYDIKISHAMAVACSALYCVKLIAIGFAFPLAYLIMFNTQEGFGAAIYRGYPVYLYTVGILFQIFHIIKRICEKRNEKSVDEMSTKLSTSFGNDNAYKTLTAFCGLISSVWFLLLFSWIIDVYRISGAHCMERNLEAASLILAFVYTLMHTAIGFYNSSVLLSGSLFVTMFGIMHMIGTNLSTWGWTTAHFTVLTVLTLQPNASERLDCEMNSPLGSFVYESHSYFGVFVSVYFLASAAVLFSGFSNSYEHATFGVRTVRAGSVQMEPQDNTRNNVGRHCLNSMSAYLPGIFGGLLLITATVLFVVYHYVAMLMWNRPTDSGLSMPIIDITFNVLAVVISCCALWAQSKNVHTLSSMNRSVLFESLILVISLFMLYVCNISFAISNFRRDSSANFLVGFRCVLALCQCTVQTTYLLAAAKYERKALSTKFAYTLDKSCCFYMIFHNLATAIFALMRQRDDLYGLVYISTFGVWFWSVYKFAVNAFVVLYRLYAAAFFCATCSRSVKIEK